MNILTNIATVAPIAVIEPGWGGFLFGPQIMKLISEDFGFKLGQSLANGLGILLGILDITFVIGLLAGIILLCFNFVKYGLKQIKKNGDETSKETQIQWKNDLKESIKGLFWIFLPLNVLPLLLMILPIIIASAQT